MNYPFYGNVRELENIVEGLVATADERRKSITQQDLHAILQGQQTDDKNQKGEGRKQRAEINFQQEGSAPIYNPSTLSLEQLEKFAIEQALRITGGNKTKAAETLGISRDSLYRKLKQYGISR
jgi:DNA-binding NtrC family response regulator